MPGKPEDRSRKSGVRRQEPGARRTLRTNNGSSSGLRKKVPRRRAADVAERAGAENKRFLRRALRLRGESIAPSSHEADFHHRGFTLWFTGLSGSGKTTVSHILEQRLRRLGARVEVLDGDVVRTNLSKGLGFSKEDRDTNIRRIGFVCHLLSRNGAIAIAAAISPYRETRDYVRSQIENFVEVYARCPLDTLIERDVKGLYKRALAGEIREFTGVSDPYEEPLHPEVVLDTHLETPEQSADKIWARLEELGLIEEVGSQPRMNAHGRESGIRAHARSFAADS